MRGGRVAAALLAAVLVAGCGDDAPEAVDAPPADPPPTETPDEPDPTPDPPQEAPPPEDPPPGEPDDDAAEPDPPVADGPLAFSARDLDGGTVDLASHAGGGPAVLWMWAPW